VSARPTRTMLTDVSSTEVDREDAADRAPPGRTRRLLHSLRDDAARVTQQMDAVPWRCRTKTKKPSKEDFPRNLRQTGWHNLRRTRKSIPPLPGGNRASNKLLIGIWN